jgi:hypothetical protein
MVQGSLSLPVVGRVDKRSLLIGAGLLLGLLVVPKVNQYTMPVFKKIFEALNPSATK